MNADELMLDLLLVEDPAVYVEQHRPMVGRAFRMSWSEICAWLSRYSMATHKAKHGAWTPAKFVDDRKVKANLVHASALLIDVDVDGDVDRIADLLVGHMAAVHETFSSTIPKPRCRIVQPLLAPVDAKTYETAWKAVVGHLAACGVEADPSTKDAGRLGFLPCRRAGDVYRFRSVDGEPLDALAVAAAQPVEPPRVYVPLPAPEHRDRYVAAALRSAADAVASTGEGQRHYQLSKEAYGLARLGLAEHEIRQALLPAFVQAAGERRQDEGARTIRDAVRARGAA